MAAAQSTSSCMATAVAPAPSPGLKLEAGIGFVEQQETGRHVFQWVIKLLIAK